MYKTILLDTKRDRLAMTCFMGDRYRGLGEDVVASLYATAMVEREG